MNIMKSIILTAFTGCLFFFFSCSEDEETPGYNFLDQNLQGEIDGTSWIFRTGTAEPSSSMPNQLSIEMVNEEIIDPCSQFFFDQEQIFFSVPNQLGLYQLDLQSQTVTFFIPPGSNFIAGEGAIEIQSIDTSNGIVTGRMDVRANDNTSANGNFTLEFCD